MNRLFAITFSLMVLGCGASCANEPSTLSMTTPVPSGYFQAAAQKGTVEVVEYESKDYTGSTAPTHKPAYVYLPYGYDSSKKYDIIYLIHGWTGNAQGYFGMES